MHLDEQFRALLCIKLIFTYAIAKIITEQSEAIAFIMIDRMSIYTCVTVKNFIVCNPERLMYQFSSSKEL
ncbi:hypothetical protein [Calothrix sp. NIES-2100]|uniref:hypothetical protein n=1 Tax=Calothrix sp. NIES-2100 TaxID=1954172 RepID=UPI000BBCDD70